MHEARSTLDVETDGSLKVKRCTLVITNYNTSSNSKAKMKDEGKPSSHLVTVLKVDDLKAKTRTTEVLENPKKCGRLPTWSNHQQLLTTTSL